MKKLAFNNWGLALQELSAIVPVREKQAIVKTAINKYGLAEDTSRTGGSVNVKERLYYDGNNGVWYSYDHQTQQYVPYSDQSDNKTAGKQN
ncbi:unnamed protein product [Camellia sinensis]